VAQAAPAAQSATLRSASSGYSGGSIKDDGYAAPTGGTLRAHGVWAEGYYDQEKRDNLAPNQANNQDRRTVSGGVISGFDVSNYQIGSVPSGFQIGAFSGYNSTRSKFSDVTLTTAGSDNASVQRTTFGEQRQEMDGAFIGMYGSVVHGAFSADLAVKVDMFDIDSRFKKSEVFDELCGAGPGPATVTTFTGSTAMTNYVVASNANYRIPLSMGHYIEPTVGVRYSYSDFGGNAAALGFRDGDAFRVQGGLRLGTRFNTRDGWIWNTSVTGLLYSDVAINGYTVTTVTPGLPPPVSAKLDEGKLRVMGVLENRVDVGYGYTLYNDFEVRAGDDYLGFGTRAGIRYQW